jgi:hypothetical protein
MVKFWENSSEFVVAGGTLMDVVVDIMVWAKAAYFEKHFPFIPLPIAAKIALGLKRVQTEEKRLELQNNKKTGKDFYVKE